MGDLYEKFDHCHVCGSSALKAMNGYERDYLMRCGSCGFVFCSRKPTPSELDAHYALYPRNQAISEITLRRYNDLLDTFEPFRKTNNLIDIGCGDGFFLVMAKKRNWNVYGTEFSQEAIEVCTTKGIQMTQSPLRPEHYSKDFFDVITWFEVIEHINAPVEELKAFYKILRPAGLVYVTTPNFNSVSRNVLKQKWNVIEYPEHLSYYTRSTLSLLFRKEHFKKLKVSTTGISLQRLKASSQAAVETEQPSNSDEDLRQKIEQKPTLQIMKAFVNGILNVTAKGDSLKGYFKKV